MRRVAVPCPAPWAGSDALPNNDTSRRDLGSRAARLTVTHPAPRSTHLTTNSTNQTRSGSAALGRGAPPAPDIIAALPLSLSATWFNGVLGPAASQVCRHLRRRTPENPRSGRNLACHRARRRVPEHRVHESD